jgi:hypothetical protein
MNERRLQGFYSVEWGKGAQTPPPRPTPPSRAENNSSKGDA